MKFVVFSIAILFLSGCLGHGYNGFVEYSNEIVGVKIDLRHLKPYPYEDSGKIIRERQIQGRGLTHITKDKNGDFILHYDIYEVLPSQDTPEYVVGKCQKYIVVDKNTSIVIGWGFEPKSNPKSCSIGP